MEIRVLKLIGIVTIVLSFAQLRAQIPGFLGTQLVNGTYTTYTLTDLGLFRQVRLQATSSGSNRNWEFGTGTAASPNYSDNWRPYGGPSSNTNLPAYNQIITPNTSYPSTSGTATYNSSFGGTGGLFSSVTNGNYYTVNITEYSGANQNMAVLETSYNPVAFSSISGNPSSAVAAGSMVDLTVTTASAPSSGENIYVRYSTSSSFATSSFAQVSMSGATGTVSIPACSAGSNVYYYFFSSNIGYSAIQTAVSGCCQDVYDMLTLNLLNNGGANYSFTVNASSTVFYGNYTIPSSCFATLNAFATAINAGTITGPVTCSITGGYTETVPSNGILFTATGNNVNPITIKHDGTGAKPIFNASSSNTANSRMDAILKFVGSDWITIDGLVLTENSANTTSSAYTDLGIALLNASTTNSCRSVTITNCEITLNFNHRNGTGIFGNCRQSSTNIGTVVNPISVDGVLDSIVILGNVINNANAGIYLSGYTGSYTATYCQIGSTTMGNTISNFGYQAIASKPAGGITDRYGVCIRNFGSALFLSNNISTTSSTGTSSPIHGIYFNTATGAAGSGKVRCKNNFVSMQLQSEIDMYAIDVRPLFMNTKVIEISDNTIKGLTYGTGFCSNIYPINCANTNGIFLDSVIIKNNTIDSIYMPVGSGTKTFGGLFSNKVTTYYHYYGYNTISRVTNLNGIANFGVRITQNAPNYASNSVVIIEFNNITTFNSNASITAIHVQGANVPVNFKSNISNNSISNLTSSAQFVRGINLDIAASAATLSTTNRPFHILKNNSLNYLTAASNLNGLRILRCKALVDSNSIKTTIAGWNNYGIFTQNVDTFNAKRNTLDSIVSNATATSYTSSGLYLSGNTHYVNNNKINDIIGNSTAADCSGIYVVSGDSCNLFNNCIRSITSANTSTTAPSAIGIGVAACIKSELNHNAVYLLGSNTYATGIEFGSNTCKAFNNLIYNTCSSASSLTTAVQNTSSVYTNYTASNNCYQATNAIVTDSTNTFTTIASFRAVNTTKELNTVAANPIFVSTDIGSDSFLCPKSNTMDNCPINGGALYNSTYDKDFLKAARSTTKPDIGAFEFTFDETVNLTEQPISVSVCEGTTHKLKLKYTAIGIPTIQWLLNNTIISNGAKYSGVNDTVLQISNFAISDTGKYKAILYLCPESDTTITIEAKLDLSTLSIAPTSITLSKDTICPSISFNASVVGGSLGSGAVWTYSLDSCNGSSIGTGASTTLSLSNSAQVYVKAAGTCNTTMCVWAPIIVVNGTAGYWAGLVDSNWNNAANWCSGIPTLTTDVVVPANVPHSPHITATSYARKLTIESGTKLRMNANTLLNIAGDFICNGDSNIGPSGRFKFVGTSSQSIGKLHVSELELSNNAGVVLTDSLRVKDSLILNNGILSTTSAYKVTLESTSSGSLSTNTANATFANSWINGRFTRHVATNTQTYYFPVGNNTAAYPIHFINKNLAGPTNITANYDTKPGTDAGLSVVENSVIYGSIGGPNVWYFTPNASPTNGFYALKLYFNSDTSFTNSMYDYQFAILRRPDNSSNGADWSIPASSKYVTTAVADGFAMRDSVSTFSQLGIGLTLSPLPIHFVHASGIAKDNKHVLYWEMGGTNYDKFVIVDALTQLAVAEIDAVYAQQLYQASIVANGTQSYQIIAYAFGAPVATSAVITIAGQAQVGWQVYPNPANNFIQLVAADKTAQSGIWELRNAQGQLIDYGTIANRTTVINTQQAAAGMYYLTVRKKNSIVLVHKIVISK